MHMAASTNVPHAQKKQRKFVVPEHEERRIAEPFGSGTTGIV
jgi:hypothetical protein